MNTWTVDDPVRLRALAAMGIDGIIANVAECRDIAGHSWVAACSI